MSDNTVLISYIVLGGCGIYGLGRHGTALSLSHGCFGLVTLNACTWLIRQASGDLDNKLSGVNRFLSYCQLLFALPCITTGVWLAAGYQKELAWAHAGVSLIPLIAYIADKEVDRGLIDLILAVNSVSMGVVSYLSNDLWGVATAIIYGCTHFIFYENYASDKDAYNFMMGLYVFFAAGPW